MTDDPRARYALHCATLDTSNLVTQIAASRSAGYDAIELTWPHVERYLAAGYSTPAILAALGDMQVTMLNAVIGIERLDANLREQAARMCQLAVDLGCPTIQAVPHNAFSSDSWPVQRAELVSGLASLSRIAGQYGCRVAVEPLCYSPFNTLAKAIEVLTEVNAPNAGLCLDTWHQHASGEGWDIVAQISPETIYAVQLSDAHEKRGRGWTDADRTALLGDGVVSLGSAVGAIAKAGYAGPWTVEMHSPVHWEWEPYELARITLDRARSLMQRSQR